MATRVTYEGRDVLVKPLASETDGRVTYEGRDVLLFVGTGTAATRVTYEGRDVLVKPAPASVRTGDFFFAQ